MPYDDNNNTNLILRSRAQHGVSKDGPQHVPLPTLRDAPCGRSSG